MTDVLIVGAGPAGSVAATVLARAGVGVQIVDRSTFPREKLCGDTVNPGTLARLRQLQMSETIDQRGVRVDGMLVTGEGGVAIEGRYPDGLSGRSLIRSELDWALLQEAMKAGAVFEPGLVVRRAKISENPRGTFVDGVIIGGRGGARPAMSLPARVIIAADGRSSTLAFGLGLAHHPPRPRRWAIGAYFENALGRASHPSTHASLHPSLLGEMHIRGGRYIGVAPVPGGLTNVCLVAEAPLLGSTERIDFRDPTALLRWALDGDDQLRDRFAGARLAAPPVVLGPLAVDRTERSVDGLLLAGDAAGFVDPMTGDGLRFAVRGAELAAAAALDALQHGWTGIHANLAAARRREFAEKWRFNRALRALVASPTAVRMAGVGARLAPGLVRGIVARAGDCDLVQESVIGRT